MIRAVVTDIEGTTSSLSFVKDVLFPYARVHMEEFIRAHEHDDNVAPWLEEVQRAVGAKLSLDEIIAQLRRWIDEDRKEPSLKAIQGVLWEHGYQDHEFTGHVYPDAVNALREWHEQGIGLYVYSSGSVRAQQLLFAHTQAGDLTELFSGYFDTRTGAKGDVESYRRIAASIGLPPEQILFLSDVVRELDAARAAGMQTTWLVREPELGSVANHKKARDFTEIHV